MLENFYFQENPLIKYLICSVCQKVFYLPIRLHRCGHTFCRSCSPDVLKKCPCCLSIIEKKQTDLFAAGLINDLLVRCTVPDCPF